MKKLKIGARLFAGFIVILLMLVAVAGISYVNLNMLGGEIDNLVKDKWVKSQLLADLDRKLDDVSTSINIIALSDSAEVRKREAAQIAEFSRAISQDLETLDKIVPSDAGKKYLAAIKMKRDAYREELKKAIDYGSAGKQDEVAGLVLGLLAEKKLEYNRAVDEMNRHQVKEVERVSAECAGRVDMSKTLLFISGIAAVILGCILSAFISRSITNPLNDCVEAAERIAAGDTGVILNTSAHDETGALQQSMLKMTTAIKLMSSDALMLSEEALAGKLTTRADAAKHQGEFRAIVQGFNEALDAVMTPLNEVRSIIESMAGGDLSRRMTGDARGEFAILKDSLNNSMQNIASAIGNVTQNARQVASASSQTSAAVGQISDGSQNQLHAIGQVATAVKQTAASIADVSRNTEEASLRAKASVVIVNEGQAKMAQMVAVVNNIAANSEKINKITDVIEKIANKTNLLSLNAAIEAARAGEHGRGFAVVAEEVGKLAANAADSTQEIVVLVNQAVKEANNAVSTVNEVSSGMQRISEGALQTESMLQRISAALEEQSAAVQEINANITSLNKVAESNATASEEITATVVELSRLADNTRKEAELFKV